MNISIDDHPLLDAVLLYTRWPTALEHVETLPTLDEWFSMEATSPLVAVDDIKTVQKNAILKRIAMQVSTKEDTLLPCSLNFESWIWI